MDSVEIKIKNGYGIKKLDHMFTFGSTDRKPHNSTLAVYAQNGTMKSSFTKTIRDHVKGEPIKDHIFEEPGNCTVITDGHEIPSSNVLAITSFDTSPFEASNISSLVASEQIKTRYDLLMQKYDNAWQPLITKIKSVSRTKSTWKEQDILREILSQYGSSIAIEPRSLINIFINKGDRDEIDKAPSYIQSIPYTKLDTLQVSNFMKENAGIIKKLVDVYDEIRKSPTFYKNGFDASAARKLSEATKSSKYFNAEHSLNLKNVNTGGVVPVSSQDELQSILATDIDAVLDEHPELRKPFEKLIEKFGAGNHSDLRAILESDTTKDIVLIMDNPALFKRRIWQGYLQACREEADEVIRVHNEIEKDLIKVVKDAQNEKTRWDDITKQFNDRFHNLPYTVHIDNKDSVIFDNTKIPEIVLRYQHPTDKKRHIDFKRDTNNTYPGTALLSTGERKAFYLLNILFELEVRRESGEQHLILLDDIVDSFDYKNKYAFLEYINDISANYDNLSVILLTHNFDFFRLLQSRLKPIDSDHFLIATKHDGEIKLDTADCFEIFSYMRKNAHSDRKVWLSTIPFVRNLLEFQTDDLRGTSTDYMKLTKCLHSLDDDQPIADAQSIMSSVISLASHPFDNDTDQVNRVLLSTADDIVDDGSFNIYDNIVLAMACRRMAEDYMKYKMAPQHILDAINDSRPLTMALYVRYKNNSSDSNENKECISKINLITPEHIHLNAFAYEPLIDIDKSRLVKLRDEIAVLYNTIT